MKELVLLLAEKDIAALGAVRCFPGLKAAAEGDQVWLRGIPAAEKAAPEIRCLPALATFFLDESERLFPQGGATPVQRLGAHKWLPLAEFLPLELPVSPLPGKQNETYALRLSPSGRNEAGQALLTTLGEWTRYADRAPQARLQKIKFAVSENDEVLLLGAPLLPLPGKEYWLRDDLLLPCGFDFDPPVLAAFAAAQLNPGQDAVLLFEADGSWQRIPKKEFVAAGRSAVRLTAEGRKHG